MLGSPGITGAPQTALLPISILGHYLLELHRTTPDFHKALGCATRQPVQPGRLTGKKLGAAMVDQADNIAWDNQGQLLAVSHSGALADQMACSKTPGQTCGFEFTVFRINPETMSSEVALKHQGAPMGAGTIARQLGDKLFIGSFSSDRIIFVPYKATDNH